MSLYQIYGTYYSLKGEKDIENKVLRVKLLFKEREINKIEIKNKNEIEGKIQDLLEKYDFFYIDGILGMYYTAIRTEFDNLTNEIIQYSQITEKITNLEKKIFQLETQFSKKPDQNTNNINDNQPFYHNTSLKNKFPTEGIFTSSQHNLTNNNVIKQQKSEYSNISNLKPEEKINELFRGNLKDNHEYYEKIEKSKSLKLNGKISESITLLESIQDKLNNDFEGLNLLGSLYFKKRDFIKALDCYKQSYALNPTSKDCLVGLADVYRIMRRSQLALGILEEAERLFKEDKDIYSCFGLVFEALGDSEKALAYFEKASQFAQIRQSLGPNHFDEENIISNINPIQGNPKVETNVDIINNQPDNSIKKTEGYENLIQIGIRAYNENNFDSAIENLEKATELEPENIRAFHNLGVVAERANDKKKALLAFKRAKEISLKDNNTSKVKLYESWITKLTD